MTFHFHPLCLLTDSILQVLLHLSKAKLTSSVLRLTSQDHWGSPVTGNAFHFAVRVIMAYVYFFPLTSSWSFFPNFHGAHYFYLKMKKQWPLPTLLEDLMKYCTSCTWYVSHWQLPDPPLISIPYTTWHQARQFSMLKKLKCFCNYLLLKNK